MKKILFSLVCFALTFLISSCANKTQAEINADCSSGVVLIRTMSYYELRLSNGDVYFFNSYDKENGLNGWTSKRYEVQKNETYGTGFFVDNKGLIATNKHVISGTITEKDVKDALREVIGYTIYNIKNAYESLNQQYNQAKYEANIAYENNEIDNEAIERTTELARRLDDLFASYQKISSINPEESKLIYHTEVGISYNNSLVMKTSEIHPCDIVAKSKNHDLALIKLKTGATPINKHIFSIPTENPLTTYSLGDKLKKQMGNDKNNFIYMIGFNLGPALALTDEGIKAQINMGNISQQSQQRLMYSIPALPGSSGSPVVNAQEELVAVNFAGINTTQNFNYGIPIKFLKELINRTPFNE